tara:strand:+ start:1256 stop:1726 length:471 start_codon:yes stop_codon:yes gene_type:complete
MLKKFILPLFIIFFSSNCGFTPVYLNMSGTNFEISNLELNGNNQVNRIVENKLRKYLNNNKKRKYNVEIVSNYKKVSVSKDSTGNTTNFKLIIDLNLNYTEFNSEKKIQSNNIFYSEQLIIKRNPNNYEQNSYEQILIKNMSELLIEKIILHLSRS